MEEKMLEVLQNSLDLVRSVRESGHEDVYVTRDFFAQKYLVEAVTGKTVVAKNWIISLEG